MSAIPAATIPASVPLLGRDVARCACIVRPTRPAGSTPAASLRARSPAGASSSSLERNSYSHPPSGRSVASATGEPVVYSSPVEHRITMRTAAQGERQGLGAPAPPLVAKFASSDSQVVARSRTCGANIGELARHENLKSLGRAGPMRGAGKSRCLMVPGKRSTARHSPDQWAVWAWESTIPNSYAESHACRRLTHARGRPVWSGEAATDTAPFAPPHTSATVTMHC